MRAFKMTDGCWKRIVMFVAKRRDRRYILPVIILLNATIIAILLVLYFQKTNHLVDYCFAQEQIASYTSEVNGSCFGGRINEDHEAGLYDAIPETEMFLPKGYYKYTVQYKADSVGSFIWPHTYVDYYNVIQEAVTYFEEGEHVNSDAFWLNADLNVALRLWYSGSGSAEILSFEIEETKAQANIDLFGRIAMLLFVDLVMALVAYQKKYGISDHAKYSFICLFLIWLFASFPLLVDYAVTGHDFDFHFVRIEGVKDGLLSGQFPVRISPTFHNGYGYAVPIFYGELLLYVPALFRLIGFPLTTCYNIYCFFLNALTCFGGYYCFKSVLKRRSTAVIVTLLYTLAPYRLMCIYLRSAMGEVSAIAFLPFVVCGLYRIYVEDVNKKEYKSCFIPLVIGLTGIINSHVLTGEITAGVILMTCVLLFFRTFRRKRFWALCKTVLWTLGLNLWYLVPFVDFALTQKIAVFQAGKLDHIQDSGIFLAQLVGLFQRYGGGSEAAENGLITEMPLSLGMPLVLGLCICAVMIFVGGVEKDLKRSALFTLLITAIVCWMATLYFPWDRIATTFHLMEKLISQLQYVWRFLGYASATAALTTGLGLVMLSQKEGRWVGFSAGIILCILTSVSAMNFMQECLYSREPIRLNDTSHTDTVNAAMYDEYVLAGASWDWLMYEHEPKVYGGEISDYEKEGTNVAFSIKSTEEDCYVLLPLLNYKGYSVSSKDGVITDKDLSTGEWQTVRIDFPKDYSGKIAVKYKGFWYWRLSEAVSYACLLYLLGGYLYKKIKMLRILKK